MTHPLVKHLAQYTAVSAGAATKIIQIARAHCVGASYHPAGGHSPKEVIPTTHLVFVEGTADQLEEIKAIFSEHGELFKELP